MLAGLAVACDLIEGLVAPTELERARARGLALATGEAVPESIRGSIRATQEATVSASLGAELSHTG